VSSLTNSSGAALARERYVAIKLHFNSDSYDFFKYSGRVNKSSANSRDAAKFSRMDRKYKGQALTDYILANVLDGKNWIGDFSEKSYTEWRKRVESLRYHLTEQVRAIADASSGDIGDMWRPSEHRGYPPVLIMHMGRRLSLETMAATDMVLKYTKLWKKEFSRDVIVPPCTLRIRKYVPFMAQRISLDDVSALMKGVVSRD